MNIDRFGVIEIHYPNLSLPGIAENKLYRPNRIEKEPNFIVQPGFDLLTVWQNLKILDGGLELHSEDDTNSMRIYLPLYDAHSPERLLDLI